jgi:hypothetical protein
VGFFFSKILIAWPIVLCHDALVFKTFSHNAGKTERDYMKRALKKINAITLEQLRNDRSLKPEITGEISDELYGEVTGLYGDVSGLRGNVSGLRGNVTGLSGYVSGLRGYVSGLYGEVTGLYGEVTGLRGNVSGLRGNVSGLSGNVSGLRGNVDDCGITDDERKNGVEISDLIS